MSYRLCAAVRTRGRCGVCRRNSLLSVRYVSEWHGVAMVCFAIWQLPVKNGAAPSTRRRTQKFPDPTVRQYTLPSVLAPSHGTGAGTGAVLALAPNATSTQEVGSDDDGAGRPRGIPRPAEHKSVLPSKL